MKILYLCRSVGMGGIEKNLLLLTREFVRAGHEVLIGAMPGFLREDLEDAGAKFFPLYASRQEPLESLASVFQLRKILAEEKPDIVHVYSATGSISLMLAKALQVAMREKVPPVVSSVMGLQESPDEHAFKTSLRTYLIVAGSAQTFVISPEIRKQLESLPIEKSKLFDLKMTGVLPCTEVEPKPKAEVFAELGVKTKHMIVTIGALVPRKTHAFFIRAAKLIHDSRKDVSFVILGDGPDRQMLESLADELGIGDFVHLVGVKRDLPSILAAADVCVKPGIVEGFIGMTVLEAQVVATPVVAFDTVDVRLAIDQGKTGLIAKRGDVDDLAEKVLSLLNDAEFSKAVGEQGQEYVHSEWTIDVIAEKILEHYQALLPAG